MTPSGIFLLILIEDNIKNWLCLAFFREKKNNNKRQKKSCNTDGNARNLEFTETIHRKQTR